METIAGVNKALQNLFDFGALDMSALSNISDELITKIANKFYDEWVRDHPEIQNIFNHNHSDTARLKARQVEYWKELFKHHTSEGFLENPRKIGVLHQKYGVTPAYYIAGYSFFLREMSDQLVANRTCKSNKVRPTLQALTALVLFDIATVLECYVQKEGNVRKAEQKEDMLFQLSSDAVDVSISINDMFVNIIKSYNRAEEVQSSAQAINSTVETMVGNVKRISGYSSEASELSLNAAQETEKGSRAVDSAVKSVNKIDEAVSGTQKAVESLGVSAKQIEEFATTIDAIARQTNLLALNATIEAARAGEAGKGFAVVAAEVKQLSDQTSKASEDIRERIQSLLQDTTTISSDMTNVQSSVSEGIEVMTTTKNSMEEINRGANMVNQRMQEISSILQTQEQSAQEVSEAVVGIQSSATANCEASKMSEQGVRQSSRLVEEQLTRLLEESQSEDLAVAVAKSDHIVWKRRLADMLIANNPIDRAQLKDHTVCRLGKWYYSHGKEQYGTLDAYKRLEEPHKRVHAHGLEAAALHNEGKADEALEAYQKMEEASLVVLEQLEEMQKAITAHRQKQRK